MPKYFGPRNFLKNTRFNSLPWDFICIVSTFPTSIFRRVDMGLVAGCPWGVKYPVLTLYTITSVKFAISDLNKLVG